MKMKAREAERESSVHVISVAEVIPKKLYHK